MLTQEGNTILELLSGKRDLAHPEGLNWEVMIDIAQAHCVLPLFFRALKESSLSEMVPVELEARVRVALKRLALRNMESMSELLRILKQAQEGNVRVCPYKGPVLALQLHGDPGLRMYHDLDFLCPESEVLRFIEVLHSLGYQPSYPWVSPRPFLRFHYEYRLCNPVSGQVVEVKWRPCSPNFGRWALPVDSWEQRQLPPPLKGSYYGPDLETMFTLLLIHGTKHCWSRLQWLCDLRGLADKVDWTKIDQMLEKRGAFRCSELACQLARAAFGCDGLRNFALANPPHAALQERVVSEIIESWFQEAGMGRAREFRILLDSFDSPLNAAMFLFRSCFRPAPSDILALRFEPSWHGFYYLVRPIRSVLKLVGADILQDLRKARKG